MSEEGLSETPLWADDRLWDDAERYWRDEIDRLSVELGQAGEWPSWEATTFADGVTPVPREFRSVCEGRSDRLDRAFRILQATGGDEGPSIAARVKDYERDEFWNEDESPRLPALLVISLAFSEETAECARTLASSQVDEPGNDSRRHGDVHRVNLRQRSIPLRGHS